ncbi:MAG: class I SAM-dependent methyltransferase [bacterium]|nr:class I SAM-dependent methyltransferase [bacterium]
MDLEKLFLKVEKYKVPPTILFRSIEIKLLREKIAHLLEPSRPALDLGCGDGTAALAVFDGRIDYGLDNESEALKTAEKDGIYGKTIFADAGNIPLPDNCLKLVFCNCSLEHMENLDLVLKEVSRVLMAGGLFIFTTPSHNFKNYSFLDFLQLKTLAKIYGNLRDRRQHHYHSHSLEDWSSILAKFNLKKTDGYYYLDKKVLEFWDFLLILYLPFSLLMRLSSVFEILTDKIYSGLIYRIFFRKKIYQKFLESKISGPDGAAVCVIANKEMYAQR